MLHPDVFEKSQALLVDELSRCSLLGLNLYNFHPGSSLGTITTEQCVDKIAGAINHAHQQTPAVVTGTQIPILCGSPALKTILMKAHNIWKLLRRTEVLMQQKGYLCGVSEVLKTSV